MDCFVPSGEEKFTADKRLLVGLDRMSEQCQYAKQLPADSQSSKGGCGGD